MSEIEWTPERWSAFFTIGEVQMIATPGFARRARLAREQGLLDSVLADDRQELLGRASELISRLAAQIHPEYQPSLFDNPKPVDRH